MNRKNKHTKLVTTVATGMLLGNILLTPMDVLATNVGAEYYKTEESIQGTVLLPIEQELPVQNEQNVSAIVPEMELSSEILSAVHQTGAYELEITVEDLEQGDFRVNWNSLTKTLQILSNQANINEIADTIKQNCIEAIGVIERLELHGHFDNTPLASEHQTLFDSASVEGDAINLAPKMFENASKLTSVKLPLVATFSGDEFNQVSSVTDVEIGMKPTDTFFTVRALFKSSASSIKNLIVHNITSTGDFSQFVSPFQNLEHVDLPALTYIGEAAFSKTFITTIEIPKVTYIGDLAFSGTKLTSITGPEVSHIGHMAFFSSNLTQVNMPKVVSIDETAFDGVDSIKDLSLGMSATDTLATIKILFNDSANNITQLKVDNITNTGDFPMLVAPFKQLEYVELPELTSIGEGAFFGTSISTIDFPKVTHIGYAAFSSTPLVQLSLPAAIYLDGNAFAHTKLTNVELPEVEAVEFSIFSSAPLTQLSMPKLITIDDAAFEDVTTLQGVEVGMVPSDTLETVRSVFSESADTITTLKVNNITHTGDFTSSPFKKLVDVELPNATTIGTRAFHLNKELISLKSPNVVSMGKSALDTTKVTELDLPELKELGAIALYNTPLTNVNFPKLEKIGERSFQLSTLSVLSTPKLKTTHENSWGSSKLDYVFFPESSGLDLKHSFDSNTNVIGVGVETEDVEYSLIEGTPQTLSFDEVLFNESAMEEKDSMLQALYVKGEAEYKGTPLDYTLTVTNQTAGEYLGRIVVENQNGQIQETGVSRKHTIKVKEL